jgi:hypothetical protein
LYETKDHCAAIEFERRVAVTNIILFIRPFSEVIVEGSWIVIATLRSSYTNPLSRNSSYTNLNTFQKQRVLADQFVAPRRGDQPVVTAGIYPGIKICGSTIQNRMTENQNNGAVQIGNKDEFDQEQDKKKHSMHNNSQKYTKSQWEKMI